MEGRILKNLLVYLERVPVTGISEAQGLLEAGQSIISELQAQEQKPELKAVEAE